MNRLILPAVCLFAAVFTHVSRAGLPPGIKDTQDPNDKPMPPAEALKKLALPEGFHATLFAGEPDVMQPPSSRSGDSPKGSCS